MWYGEGETGGDDSDTRHDAASIDCHVAADCVRPLKYSAQPCTRMRVCTACEWCMCVCMCRGKR